MKFKAELEEDGEEKLSLRLRGRRLALLVHMKKKGVIMPYGEGIRRALDLLEKEWMDRLDKQARVTNLLGEDPSEQ